MKKIFLLLSVLISSISIASALTPDEIIGKWESNPIKQEASPEMPFSITEKNAFEFKADNTLAYQSETSMTMEIGGGAFVDIFAKIAADGNYTIAGDSLTYTIIPETIKVKFTEDDIRIRGVEDAAAAMDMQKQMYEGFNQNFAQMAQSEELKKPATLNEVLVTGKKFVCKEGDQFMTYKRKK